MFTWNDHHSVQTDLWFCLVWRGIGSTTVLSYRRTLSDSFKCASLWGMTTVCVDPFVWNSTVTEFWMNSSLCCRKALSLVWVMVFNLNNCLQLFFCLPMFNQALVQSIMCHMFKFFHTPQVWLAVLNWQARCCTFPFKYSIRKLIQWNVTCVHLRDACLWAICVL